MREEADALSMNFWPSFADLMLALVLILVLTIFIVAVGLRAGSEDLTQIRTRQAEMVKVLADAYNTTPQPTGENAFRISTSPGLPADISFYNDLNLQRITFSDRILFRPDDHTLNDSGKEVLKRVGEVLRRQLESIREIQIQGHADPDTTTRYRSNTELAARRAIEVFEFFQKQAGIDPAKHLMSATSFGEFNPVQRVQANAQRRDAAYDIEALKRDNLTADMKRQNRRIELVLLYRQ